ncbi:hypothetical protein DAEQUDRAFT_739664 [Daedalea quercina L-15889]|uniref:Ubiquitin 3 binding protein But2 C-terminal domain-containing protein n=1 Tax=Daedalea quercina L-15889 TaxID=1314783 RepID=A0A165NEZ7_9APHY|nr:hypothetical protein DAEQUDRAFT_739664 [Daedalea quercina L-15889]
MFASAFFSLTLAASFFAVPAALTARQDPSQGCQSVVGGLNTLAYDFTLSVVDPSASGANATGPTMYLVETPEGEGVWWLQRVVDPSTPIDFLSWKLFKSSLIPNPSSSSVGLAGSDFAVPTGSIVEFSVTNNGSGNASAGRTPYCVMTDSEGDAILAVNGDTQSFAVCETPSEAQVLVYTPTSDNDGAYDYSTCTSQKVQLVQA